LPGVSKFFKNYFLFAAFANVSATIASHNLIEPEPIGNIFLKKVLLLQLLSLHQQVLQVLYK